MGLTVHYDWKTKADLASARRMIARFRVMTLKLPFDDVSEIHEQVPPVASRLLSQTTIPFAKVICTFPADVGTELKRQYTCERCTRCSSTCASRARKVPRSAWRVRPQYD
jgi:hypothetical protein